MKTIILAGGLGLRLQSILSDLPKPMAQIAGRPFLEFLLLQLRNAGIKEVVLAVGYKAEKIKETFKDGHNFGMEITYSTEDAPLGTAGALKKAAASLKEEDIIVMNADSFFDIDLNKLAIIHGKYKAKITIAVKKSKDIQRFGLVAIDNANNITSFNEKDCTQKSGFINGGIYCINKQVINTIPEVKSSLEYDIFPKWQKNGLKALKFDGFFVDIGVPESFYKINEKPEQILSAIGLINDKE